MRITGSSHGRTAVLLLVGASLTQGLQAAPAPEGWSCQWCPAPARAEGHVEAGVGYVSEDSARFGRYTGRDEKGPYAIADGEARYRGDGGQYLEAEARDLGLESREARIEGGRQGLYEAAFNYDKLPRIGLATSRSPFRGVGGTDMTLPSDWVPARSTRNMTALAGSLQDADIAHDRERFGGELSVIPARNWHLRARFQREEKEGIRALGGAIGPGVGSSRAAILPVPIDYTTDQAEAAVAYAGARLQVDVGYRGSYFDNDNEAVVWDNPFATANQPERGRISLQPDNEFHQLFASLGYDLASHTRASANVALGRMTQDEDFLPFTINPGLATALPRDSLDGEVDTTQIDLKLTSRPLERLRLKAAYRYDERDNETPQARYPYVIADALPSPDARTNLPYSFEQDLVDLSAGYQVAEPVEMSAGYEYDRRERTFQEVDETEEHSVWGRVDASPTDILDIHAEYARAERDRSDYELVAEIVPPQNPLLRKFNMADRDRDRASLFLTLTPYRLVSLSLSGDYSRDDYTDSPLGLQEAEQFSYTLEASLSPTRRLHTHAYYTRERIFSEQTGSQSFGTGRGATGADWSADNDDTIDTVGLGLKFAAIPGRLDLRADYAYSRSVGDISVRSDRQTLAPFPDLETDLHRLSLRASYQLREDLSLELGYLYEEYDADDWARDDVVPDTIPHVLTLGEGSQFYQVNVYQAALRYGF